MATIQWYPGHMNKARNQLEDKLVLMLEFPNHQEIQ